MFHLIIILFSPFPFLVVKIELLRFAFLFPPPVLHTRTTRIPGASLVAQRLKRLPPMQETRVWSLGREDPLEKEMAIHSSIRAWRIPWMEELGRLQSMGSQRVRHDWLTSLHFTLLPWCPVVRNPLAVQGTRIQSQAGVPGSHMPHSGWAHCN